MASNRGESEILRKKQATLVEQTLRLGTDGERAWQHLEELGRVDVELLQYVPRAKAEDPLVILKGNKHPVTYLYFVQARLSVEVLEMGEYSRGNDRVVDRAVSVIERGIAGRAVQGHAKGISTFCSLCEDIAKSMSRERRSLLAIPLLKTALAQLAPSHGTFTRLHPLILETCLLANAHTRGTAIIGMPITLLDPVTWAFEVGDYLLYRYYAGRLLAGLGRYDEAYDQYAMAIKVPCTAKSRIIMGAWANMVLCALLSPKWRPQTEEALGYVGATHGQEGMVASVGTHMFHRFAHLLLSGKVREAGKYIHDRWEEVKKGGRVGMVELVLGRMGIEWVSEMEEVYSCYPMGRLDGRCGGGVEGGGEGIIRYMAARGWVRGRIEHGAEEGMDVLKFGADAGEGLEGVGEALVARMEMLMGMGDGMRAKRLGWMEEAVRGTTKGMGKGKEGRRDEGVDTVDGVILD